jgi:hypothetical protein
MSVIDIRKEVELALKDIFSASMTKHVMLKACKVKRVNPRLRNIYVSHIGKIMNQVLQEYQEKGLIKILGIKRNHVTKWYIRVKRPYFNYAEKVKREEAIA